MKYIIKPEDEKTPGKTVADAMYPGTHSGLVSSWIGIGPRDILSKYKLGNLLSDKIQISVDTYAPGGYSTKHAHPERDQAYYIVNGKALVQVADEKGEANKGAMVLIPSKTTHAFSNTGKEPLTLLVISSYL